MSACIPTYMLASSLIAEGMNWWQAVLTIFLGNVDRAGADGAQRPRRHASTASRSPSTAAPSFGIRGANVPAAAPRPGRLRLVRHPGLDRRLGDLQDPRRSTSRPGRRCPRSPASASTLPQLACFLVFWAINMFVIYRGIDSIRVLLNIKAPLLIALGPGAARLGLPRRPAASARCSTQPSQFAPGQPKAGQFWAFFFPALTGDGRLLGDALAQHPRLHAATPTRSATRSSARRSACRRRWGCTRSSAWRSPRRPSSSTARRSGTRSMLLTRFESPVRARRRDARRSAWRRWRPTSPPTWSARPTTSPTSGRDGSPSAPAGCITGVDRHPDPAVEAGRGPDRLHLHAGWSPTRRCSAPSAAS